MGENNEPNGEMNEAEFLRAKFFAPDDEFAAAKAASEKRIAERKERRRQREDITALRAFVRHIERCPHHWRVAAVRYLADRYIYRPARQTS